MHTAENKSHTACVRFYDHGAAGIRVTAPLTVSATLWRIIAERYEWVFTFTGDADVFVVDSILEHVNQLIGHEPGKWGFEFLASGPRPDVLRQIEHRFHDLVRSGVRQRVAVAPFALPDLSVALATAAGAGLADGGRLLH
jgi:hypothetical protein